MIKGYVYTISDANDIVFYVGSTILIRPKDRLFYHISMAKKKDSKMAKKLKSIEFKAKFNIIKTIEGNNKLKLLSDLRSLEFGYIKSFSKQGVCLCNTVYNK